MTLLKKRQLKRPCSWPVVSGHYSVHCGQGAARWTSGGHLLLPLVWAAALRWRGLATKAFLAKPLHLAREGGQNVY